MALHILSFNHRRWWCRCESDDGRGLVLKISCDAINMHCIEIGHIEVRAGPAMAASDELKLSSEGQAGMALRRIEVTIRP